MTRITPQDVSDLRSLGVYVDETGDTFVPLHLGESANQRLPTSFELEINDLFNEAQTPHGCNVDRLEGMGASRPNPDYIIDDFDKGYEII